jgi:hypothetical protein
VEKDDNCGKWKVGGRWKQTGHLEDLSADGRTILKQVTKKQDKMAWTRLNWYEIGTRDDNETLGSIQGE